MSEILWSKQLTTRVVFMQSASLQSLVFPSQRSFHRQEAVGGNFSRQINNGSRVRSSGDTVPTFSPPAWVENVPADAFWIHFRWITGCYLALKWILLPKSNPLRSSECFKKFIVCRNMQFQKVVLPIRVGALVHLSLTFRPLLQLHAWEPVFIRTPWGDKLAWLV